MIESYQQQMTLEAEDRVPEGAQTATVGRVLADGVTLIWDDDGKESKRAFPVNRSVVFHTGDKVKICKVASTYLVEYPFGAPITQLHADTATRADTAAKADTATEALSAATAATADTCTTAMYLQSNDDPTDGIRLTYNRTKNAYAVLSKNHQQVWRNLATN